MLILTAKIILFGSLIGMGFIIVRKIPVLSKIPEIETKFLERKRILSLPVLGEKIKFFKSILTQKIFSKLKNLKKEKNLKEEKSHLSDDYWEKIRKG